MLERQKSNQERVNYLVGEIKRHRYLYYNEQPEISDAKYDALEDEPRKLDPDNPILFKIGVDLTQRVVDAGFDTLDKIKDASIFQLSQVDGFAEITAQQLHEGVEKLYPQMKDVLNTNKIKIEEVKETGGKLEGKTFCFTGKLEKLQIYYFY